MNNLNKSRELLKKYFRETPKEVLNQKFEKFNQTTFEGQSVLDYLAMFGNQYSFFDNNTSWNEVKDKSIETIWSQLIFSDEQSEKIISNTSSIHIKTDIEVEFDDYNYYFAQAA